MERRVTIVTLAVLLAAVAAGAVIFTWVVPPQTDLAQERPSPTAAQDDVADVAQDDTSDVTGAMTGDSEQSEPVDSDQTFEPVGKVAAATSTPTPSPTSTPQAVQASAKTGSVGWVLAMMIAAITTGAAGLAATYRTVS